MWTPICDCWSKSLHTSFLSKNVYLNVSQGKICVFILLLIGNRRSVREVQKGSRQTGRHHKPAGRQNRTRAGTLWWHSRWTDKWQWKRGQYMHCILWCWWGSGVAWCGDIGSRELPSNLSVQILIVKFIHYVVPLQKRNKHDSCIYPFSTWMHQWMRKTIMGRKMPLTSLHHMTRAVLEESFCSCVMGQDCQSNSIQYILLCVCSLTHDTSKIILAKLLCPHEASWSWVCMCTCLH